MWSTHGATLGQRSRQAKHLHFAPAKSNYHGLAPETPPHSMTQSSSSSIDALCAPSSANEIESAALRMVCDEMIARELPIRNVRM